jgi:hypothetical protein
MRVVTDQRGKRSIEIECPGCGYAWLSTAKSGKTTCPECGTRVHIPAALRREAYEPKPGIAYSRDAPRPPGGFFGTGKPERNFRRPRPLTEARRRELGFLPEPDPPTP